MVTHSARAPVDPALLLRVGSSCPRSKAGPPACEDVAALAQALVRAAPERMLWASNWPHPGHDDPAVRDEARLLDLLIEWAPEESTRRRILLDNPAGLYGF